MKKYILYYPCFLGLIIAVITGCKKYGYDFENGYDKSADSSGISVDTSGFEIDRSMYERARVFPGLVGENERRIPDTLITIDLNYTYVPPLTLGAIYTPTPIFSTGLYAGPGELIKITVPPGQFGLTVQIGSHSDDLTGLIPAKREMIVSTVKELFPGINSVRNLFGGYIWIKSKLPSSNPLNLKFQGAVKAPDYVQGVTKDVASWKNEIQRSGVPWLELRSAHIIFSVPREWVLRSIASGSMDKIDQAMELWNDIIVDDFYRLNGLTINNPDVKFRAPDLPERAVLDVQLKGGVYFHHGFPFMAQSDMYWFNEWTNFDLISSGQSVGTFTSLAKNYLPSRNVWWTGMDEGVVNFYLFKTAARRGLIPDISVREGTAEEIIPLALTYAAKTTGKLLDFDLESQNSIFKLTPLLQIFSKLSNPATGEDGWGFYPYLLNKAKNAVAWSNDNMYKRNFFYTTLCEYTQQDMASFFDAWGIPITPYYRDLMQTTYPAMQKPIWEYNPITQQGGEGTISVRKFHKRSDWTVSANSVAMNEGELNRLPALLDGNPQTFWHSCWSDCGTTGELPHIIVADMKVANKVDGFFIASRMGQTQPKSIEISVSDDNIDFQSVGLFNLENVNYNQYITLPQPKTFRYFKFTIPDMNFGGARFAAIAEIGTFFK